MQGVQQAITYEEVTAHVAKGGATLYGIPSGGTETGGFVVSWDLEKGFTEGGWATDKSDSPAFGYSEEQIQADAADGNLNTMFSEWAGKVPFETRLNWVTDWMNAHPGCVTES